MRACSVLAGAIVSLLIANDGVAQTGPPQDLRRVLTRYGCLLPDMPPNLLATVTVDHQILQEGQKFILAFWTSLEFESMEPLRVISGDARTGEWRDAQFPVADAGDRSRIGSIRHIGGLIFVNLRFSLDDNAIPVLTTDLVPRGTLHGILGNVWPHGLVRYEPHQPHWGPRKVGIGVFDPETGVDRQIYPPEECQPIRCGYVDRLRRAGGGPVPFVETEQLSPEVFDWNQHTLAFVALLRNTYYMVTPTGWDEEQTVMVVCDRLDSITSIRCRETPLASWQKAFPGVADAALPDRAAMNPQRVQP